MALLDADRFEGEPRDSTHTIDTSDLMRRLVKEKLLKFDGTPLFPERRAYSPIYPLSDDEALLYKRVTEYVKEEMNRAERLKAEGEGRRGAVVGFALTTLQRRLASSPEAIYQSLVRRRKRLEIASPRSGCSAAGPRSPRLWARRRCPTSSGTSTRTLTSTTCRTASWRNWKSSWSIRPRQLGTITELEPEITSLTDLEELAGQVRASGVDRKWEELSNLLQHTPEMFDTYGSRRKLIIFSEHRDTLNYLVESSGRCSAASEAVVVDPRRHGP